jgi:hypothetical protein
MGVQFYGIAGVIEHPDLLHVSDAKSVAGMIAPLFVAPATACNHLPRERSQFWERLVWFAAENYISVEFFQRALRSNGAMRSDGYFAR